MSQYPSYYTPPPNYPPRPSDATRLASVLLYVIGGIGILLGTCVAAATWVGDVSPILHQKGMEGVGQLSQMMHVEPEQLIRMIYTCMGVCAIVLSGALGIMGMLVRRGSRAAAIVAVVVCFLAAGYFVINALVGFVQGLGGNPVMLAGGLIAALPAIIFGFTIFALLRCLREPRAPVGPAGYGAGYAYPPQGAPPAQFTPPPTAPPPQQNAGYGYGNYPTPPPPAAPGEGEPPAPRHPPLPPDEPRQ